MTAGTTSWSDRIQPALGQSLQPRRERQQLPGQSDGVDQDERLQFHPSVRLIEEDERGTRIAIFSDRSTSDPL